MFIKIKLANTFYKGYSDIELIFFKLKFFGTNSL